MSNILIINGGKAFLHSYGKLNHTMAGFAETTLSDLGHSVKVTHIDDGYTIDDEIQKYLWADIVIYQQPAWWMGMPWTLKKYLDEVLTYGHGSLYASDGRSRHDANKKYGSGGLLHGKQYMIVTTWNAPEEAFTDPAQFFEGKGVDAVYFPFHKMNQFIGMTALPTFMVNNVIKEPNIERDMENFKSHLVRYFPA